MFEVYFRHRDAQYVKTVHEQTDNTCCLLQQILIKPNKSLWWIHSKHCQVIFALCCSSWPRLKCCFSGLKSGYVIIVCGFMRCHYNTVKRLNAIPDDFKWCKYHCLFPLLKPGLSRVNCAEKFVCFVYIACVSPVTHFLWVYIINMYPSCGFLQTS